MSKYIIKVVEKNDGSKVYKVRERLGIKKIALMPIYILLYIVFNIAYIVSHGLVLEFFLYEDFDTEEKAKKYIDRCIEINKAYESEKEAERLKKTKKVTYIKYP